MAKNFEDQLNELYEGVEIDDKVLNFLDAVRDARKETASALGRIATSSLIAVAIFELLISSASEELTWGPIAIDNTAPILLLIPAFVAFLQLETIILVSRLGALNEVHWTLMSLVSPVTFSSGLGQLLDPPVRLFMNPGTGPGADAPRFQSAISNIEGAFAAIVTLVLPVIFCIHAYYMLFTHDVGYTAWVYISIVFVVALVACSFYVFSLY